MKKTNEFRANALDKFHFANTATFDQFNVTPAARRIINYLTKRLQANPNGKIRVKAEKICLWAHSSISTYKRCLPILMQFFEIKAVFDKRGWQISNQFSLKPLLKIYSHNTYLIQIHNMNEWLKANAKNITDVEFELLQLFVEKVNDGEFWLDQQEMSSTILRSIRSVKRGIASLISKNLIAKVENSSHVHDQRKNAYCFTGELESYNRYLPPEPIIKPMSEQELMSSYNEYVESEKLVSNSDISLITKTGANSQAGNLNIRGHAELPDRGHAGPAILNTINKNIIINSKIYNKADTVTRETYKRVNDRILSIIATQKQRAVERAKINNNSISESQVPEPKQSEQTDSRLNRSTQTTAQITKERPKENQKSKITSFPSINPITRYFLDKVQQWPGSRKSYIGCERSKPGDDRRENDIYISYIKKIDQAITVANLIESDIDTIINSQRKNNSEYAPSLQDIKAYISHRSKQKRSKHTQIRVQDIEDQSMRNYFVEMEDYLETVKNRKVKWSQDKNNTTSTKKLSDFIKLKQQKEK